MEEEPRGHATKLEGLIEGEVTGISVDGAERYCIVTENQTRIRKFDLKTGKQVAARDGLNFMRGSVLTSNGEFWAVNGRTGHLVVLNKGLKVVKVIPPFDPAAPQEELEQDGSSNKLRRNIFKFHKYVFYFNPQTLKVYKITRRTNKIVQVIDIRRLEGPVDNSQFDECTISFDSDGRTVVFKGNPVNEGNLLLFDTFARKAVGPTNIADTVRNINGNSLLGKSTAVASFFRPKDSPPLLAVAGTDLHDRVPFVELYSFLPGSLELVAQLTLPHLRTYTAVKLFQMHDLLFLLLNQNLLRLQLVQGGLTILETSQIVRTTGFNDFNIIGDSIWSVESAHSCIKKTKLF